jgi:hypothetical protein
VGEVSYKGHRYSAEIIAHCVWLYHRFPLSFREVEGLMLVRGVMVTYETIRQWCAKFGPVYAAGLRRRQPRPGDKWQRRPRPSCRVLATWRRTSPCRRRRRGIEGGPHGGVADGRTGVGVTLKATTAPAATISAPPSATIHSRCLSHHDAGAATRACRPPSRVNPRPEAILQAQPSSRLGEGAQLPEWASLRRRGGTSRKPLA